MPLIPIVEMREPSRRFYNWIGYGNPDSPIWIIGKEEGTLEVES
jgi:hypothetical protein